MFVGSDVGCSRFFLGWASPAPHALRPAPCPARLHLAFCWAWAAEPLRVGWRLEGGSYFSCYRLVRPHLAPHASRPAPRARVRAPAPRNPRPAPRACISQSAGQGLPSL